MKSDCCILFSGGSDSTLVAFLAAKKHRTIHLLTYKHRGNSNADNSKKNVALLKKRFGNAKFIHKIIDIEKLFNKIYSHNRLKNIIKYKFTYKFIFLYNLCGACKFSMHIKTITYCIKNNIKYVYDGANTERDKEDPSQMLSVLPLIKKLHNHYNIKFKNLIYYNHSIERSDQRLYNEKFFTESNVKDDNKKTLEIQASCANPFLLALYIRRYIVNPDKQYRQITEGKLSKFYNDQLGLYIKLINESLG